MKADKKSITQETSQKKDRWKFKETDKKMQEINIKQNAIPLESQQEQTKPGGLKSSETKLSGIAENEDAIKMICSTNKKRQPRHRPVKDGRGKVLLNEFDISQSWTNYCCDLYK